MEKENVKVVTKNIAAVGNGECGVTDFGLLEDEPVGDYIKTNLYVCRLPFKSNKDDRTLYSYQINHIIRAGDVERKFELVLVPAVQKNEGSDYKDIGVYMILDLIFAFADRVPLYLQPSTYTDSQGELQHTVRYSVLVNTSEGLFVQALKPKANSDKTVLGFLTQKYLKSN